MSELLAQIRTDISNREPMACLSQEYAETMIKSIDFQAMENSDKNDEPGYSVEGNVATIKIRGLMVPQTRRDYTDWGVTGYNQLSNYLLRANDDPFIDKIVFDIDSGGGYVKGLDDVCELIYNIDKEFESNVTGNMYSAAYWLGCSADKIRADKSAGIGSIGVLIIHNEISKWLESQGETHNIFTSGKWKNAFSWLRPLKDYEAKRLQDSVDETANLFFNYVASNRNLEAKTVASWEGDTFDAMTAKNLGLVDEVYGKVTIPSKEDNTEANTTTSLSENDMELQQALAKIEEHEKTIALKTAENESLKQKNEALEKAANEVKSKERAKAIDEMQTHLGAEYSEDERKELAAMSDSAFAIVQKAVNSAPTTAATTLKIELPAALGSQKVVEGAPQKAMTKDEKIKAAITADNVGE